MVDSKVRTAVFPLPSASSFALIPKVMIPTRFTLLCMLTDVGLVEFVIEILLKVVTGAEPVMFCNVTPLKVTVEVPLVKVPLLVKCPVNPKFTNGVRVPEIVTL